MGKHRKVLKRDESLAALKSPSLLSLRVVLNTFDTISSGRPPNPVGPKGGVGHVFTRVTPDNLSIFWSCKDELSVRILRMVVGEDIPNTSAALKSVLHRLMWFRAVGELVLQFRAERPVLDSLLAESLIRNLERTQSWPYESVVKWIKYYQLALHVRFLYPTQWGQELPESPPEMLPGIHPAFCLFGGCLGKWIRHRLVSVKCRLSQRFFYSWLQTKRGCRKMDDDDILESFVKHKKALSQIASPIDEKDRVWYDDQCERILGSFKFHSTPNVEYEMSHHSSVTHTRREGGSLVAVQAALSQTPNDFNRCACLRLFSDLFPVGTEDIVGAMLGFIDFESEVTSLPLGRFEVEVVDNDGKIRREKALPVVDSGILRELGDYSAFHDGAEAIVAPVLEPLKVRLVTKGNPLVYSASMPLQKQMHGFLKRKPVFKLIGEPLEVRHLEWLEGHHFTKFLKSQVRGEFFWKSGDFSAATDTLNIGVTKLIFESWISKVPCESTRRIGRSALFEHEISYPKLKGKVVPEPFTQTTGQLMGSTLSFPVLCVANLLAYWRAATKYQKEVNWMGGLPPPKNYKGDPEGFVWEFVPFRYLSVLINGDDILFPCNFRLQELWRHEISLLGFSESPGKSVSHATLIYLNSKQFRQRANGSWEELPFFNVGVLLGQERVIKLCPKTLKIEEGSPSDLSSLFGSLHVGAVRKSAALGRFLDLHKEEISRQTGKGLFNLFADRYVGGLSFVIPDDWQFKWTRFQRRFAKVRLEQHLWKPGVKKPRVMGFEPKHRFANPDLVPRTNPLLMPKGDSYEELCIFYSDNPEYCPDLGLSVELSENRDPERYEFYRNQEELGEDETGYVFKKPREKEINAVYKDRVWRDAKLATDNEMKRSLCVINVFKLPVAMVAWVTP
jgi:hypothetical protein